MEFHRELREWLESVIRHRNTLIKKGVSYKNAYLMAENISHLKLYLGYFKYDDDLKMSRFFQQNVDKISSLLPGESSNHHTKRTKQFNYYNEKTKTIYNGENIFNRPEGRQGGNIQTAIRDFPIMGAQA